MMVMFLTIEKELIQANATLVYDNCLSQVVQQPVILIPDSTGHIGWSWKVSHDSNVSFLTPLGQPSIEI